MELSTDINWIDGDRPYSSGIYWTTVEKIGFGPSSRCVYKLIYKDNGWYTVAINSFDCFSYRIIAYMPYFSPMPYDPENPKNNPLRHIKGYE